MSDALKPLVLIVDDEPQIQRLLRVTLEANGYRVFDAATGSDGIAQAAQRRPDAVLLDLGLPDLEGMEVLEAPARMEPRAGHHPECARPRGRQGGRARRGRGRLRDQAVQQRRTARASPRRAAARPAAGSGRDFPQRRAGGGFVRARRPQARPGNQAHAD